MSLREKGLKASIRGNCVRRTCQKEEFCFHRTCSARVLGNGRLVLDNGVHVRLADMSEVRLLDER